MDDIGEGIVKIKNEIWHIWICCNYIVVAVQYVITSTFNFFFHKMILPCLDTCDGVYLADVHKGLFYGVQFLFLEVWKMGRYNVGVWNTISSQTLLWNVLWNDKLLFKLSKRKGFFSSGNAVQFWFKIVWIATWFCSILTFFSTLKFEVSNRS